MTRKRKKMAVGGPITNYITDPAEILVQNNKNLVQAQADAENNPWVIGLETLAGLGSTFSSEIFGAFTAALGGVVGDVPVEAEGEEVIEFPNGTNIELKGPSHQQGGIDLNVPSGTEFFSKRVKVDGETMAERQKKRKKKEKRIEKALRDNPTDSLLKSASERTKETGERQKQSDMDIQLALRALMREEGEEKEKFKDGGIAEFLHKMKGYASKAGGFLEENKGDILSTIGKGMSVFGPMQTTLQNRAGDLPNENFFENYGLEGLQTVGESKNLLNQIFQDQYRDLTTAKHTAQKRGANTTTSVNVARALGLSADNMAENQKRQIDTNFTNNLMQLMLTEAQMENQRDQVVAKGRDVKRERDIMDRDNFYTSMSQHRSDMGELTQRLAREINQKRQSDAMMELMKEWSMYGTMFTKDGKYYKVKDGQTTEVPADEVTPEDIENAEDIGELNSNRLLSNSIMNPIFNGMDNNDILELLNHVDPFGGGLGLPETITPEMFQQLLMQTLLKNN